MFYAASLEGVAGEWARMFNDRAGIEVRGESSGSQIAARKVSELGRKADLVIAADYHVIDWLLIPEHAGWQILFAANEIVLAHSEQSRYADELTTATWREILLRPDVRVARADENLAPIGYQTLHVWMLADAEAGIDPADAQRSLTQRLRAKIPPGLVRPDVKSLTALLGTEADYVFTYRTVAFEHNLKHLRLPDSINLSNPEKAGAYKRASAQVRKSAQGGPGGEMITTQATPILYGLTIPNGAPHPDAAERFTAMILSDEGRRVLEAHGYRLVTPPRAKMIDAVPGALQSLVKAWHEDSAR
jgi:molybdate/tungstate transport system substrate-binding protein